MIDDDDDDDDDGDRKNRLKKINCFLINFLSKRLKPCIWVSTKEEITKPNN